MLRSLVPVARKEWPAIGGCSTVPNEPDTMNTDPKEAPPGTVDDVRSSEPGGKSSTGPDATVASGNSAPGSNRSETGGLQVPIDPTRADEEVKKKKLEDEELESDPATD